MEHLVCKKCGELMYESALATTFAYHDELDIIMTNDGKLDIDSAPKYMVYSCVKCKSTHKVYFEDYFRARQELALTTLGKMRSDTCITSLDNSITYSEDSGVEFCGICPGIFDGDGVCTMDVIKNCTIRSFILENNL